MIKRVLETLFFLNVFVLTFSSLTYACETFENLSNEDVKLFRDKLIEPNADSLDKLFAFEKLACSNNPTIRALAVREGLSKSSDELVRHQILLEAMMQKNRIDIELADGRNLTPNDKKFINSHAGIYSRKVEGRDRSFGCLALHRQGCRSDDAVFIKGDLVEFNRGRITGVFRLSTQNELVGYLKPQANNRYSKIPAVIKLF